MTVIIRGIGKARKIVPARAIGTARLTPVEREMSQIFGSAIRTLSSSLDPATIARAVSSRSASPIISGLNWARFGEVMSTSRISLLRQVESTGIAEARSLGRAIGSYAFNVTDPRATTWAAARAGDLVVGVGEQVRSEIRQLIVTSFVGQVDPREIAREIPRSIGLFPRWATAVENSYQQNLASLLAEGLNPSDAMDRAQALADAYRDRLLDSRAMMIARTEVMGAANEGRAIAWQQAIDAGLIDPAGSSKEWIAEADACEECSTYDGEIVGINDLFSSDSGMPPAHPNCRCTAVLIPETVDEAQRISSEEREAAAEMALEE